MSSDFGDDSGEAMLRWAERVGERGGARALIEAAGRLGGSAAAVRERPHGIPIQRAIPHGAFRLIACAKNQTAKFV